VIHSEKKNLVSGISVVNSPRATIAVLPQYNKRRIGEFTNKQSPTSG